MFRIHMGRAEKILKFHEEGNEEEELYRYGTLSPQMLYHVRCTRAELERNILALVQILDLISFTKTKKSLESLGFWPRNP